MSNERHDADDEALSAYLDGELARPAADRLSERLAREPALRQRLDAMRGADDATRAVYRAIDELPLPQRVVDLIDTAHADRKPRQDDNVVPFPRRVLQPFLQAPVAIAASVALAVGIVVSSGLRNDAPPAASLYAAAIPAASDLHRVLEDGVGGAPGQLDGGGSGELLLTFENADGDYCRHLRVLRDKTALQAVACRQAGRWTMQAASFEAAPAPGPDGSYRPAGAAVPAAITAAVDGLIGDRAPLDRAAEQRAVASGWKKRRD